MTLPYENATSGASALGDIQKILRHFGCTAFGNMVDDAEGTILVQFRYRQHQVSVKASTKGYAAAWLKEHPYTTRMRISRVEHEQRALGVASVAIYSVLRDWIKGQVTAIETGVLSFEGAFLGQLLLPSGETMAERVQTMQLLPHAEGV